MRRPLVTALMLLAVPAGAVAQDAAAVWSAISQPAFDPAKAAAVTNLTMARDRIRIQLATGSLQFAQPLEGRVYAAAFRGQGRLQMQPPNPIEAQQLKLLAGQDSLDLEFSEALFTFGDDTFEEVAKQVAWSAAAGSDAAQLYNERQKEREDMGAEILPRLLKSVLSSDRKRTAYFVAEMKTRDKGWVQARFDALSPEEVSVGRWTTWPGGWRTVDTWMSFPAGGRSAAEAYREPRAREDFDIKGYVISATVTNAAELIANAKVTLNHKTSGERVLVFELDSNLRLESVRDEKGGALPFFQPRDPGNRDQSYGDYAAIVLPAPTTAGQAQALEFQYAGKRVVRKEGNGNFFCQSYGWYPTRPESFAARADFEIIFKSPKRYILVATGNKISETTDGDWDITVWKSDLPLAVAGFAYGDYKVVTEKAGNIDVEIYANRQGDDTMSSIQSAAEGVLPGERGAEVAIGQLTPATLAKPMATEVANTLRVFEKYFGPYPYKRLAVSSLPLSYSYGQGWPMLVYLWSLSFLDSQQRHSLGIKDHVGLTDFFRAHESSHQWWGHRVGWKSYHDQWLSEGFAQFSGNMYVQFRRGEKEYLNRLREDRLDLQRGNLKNRRHESVGPIWLGHRLSSADMPATYNYVVYAKGGYVLHMLRMMLFNTRDPQNPEARFIAMMQEFTQTHHNKPASTEDFKAVVEKYMTPAMDVDQNKKMDWFFNQYVYGVGIPEYKFNYSVEPGANNQWRIVGTVTRTGVPENWADTLPIYIAQGNSNRRLGWITAVGPVTKLDIPLPFKPEKLLLNANEDILAEIKQ